MTLMPPNAGATYTTLFDAAFLKKLERLSIISRKLRAGRMKGERRSTKRGSSVEFADYRNYAPGDDLRRVDWNAYARLERLFIKLFMEEEDIHNSCAGGCQQVYGLGRRWASIRPGRAHHTGSRSRARPPTATS